MTHITREQIADIIRDPSWIPAGVDPMAAAIDRIVIERMTCPNCNSKLEYRGEKKENTLYKAFGECPKCSYALEL